MESIAGYVLGMFCIIVGILLAAGGDSSILTSTFIDGASVFVVLGATTAAMFVAHPISDLKKAPVVFKKVLSYPLDNPAELIKKLVRYAELARKNGILALDGATDPQDDPFMSKGIQLAVDGTDPDDIRKTMEAELEYLGERHFSGQNIYANIGKYAPAFGMIGTLIGLIVMLRNLQDPSRIGPAMAVALITTMYGAVVANLFALPTADKLVVRDGQERMNKEIIINGVLFIQAGDNPRMVESKLKVFLPPKLRGEDS